MVIKMPDGNVKSQAAAGPGAGTDVVCLTREELGGPRGSMGRRTTQTSEAILKVPYRSGDSRSSQVFTAKPFFECSLLAMSNLRDERYDSPS